MVNSEIADREGREGSCWKLSHIALEFSAWKQSYKYQVGIGIGIYFAVQY